MAEEDASESGAIIAQLEKDIGYVLVGGLLVLTGQ